MSEPLDAIRQLYFRASAETIEADFDTAIDLLKQMPSEDDRERAAVFMEGLAEMKKQWARPRRPAGRGASPAARGKRR